jgi:type IV pilus assembly protein PilN
MAHVNLLPWRAARRKQREREFYMQLGASFVVALGVLLLWVFWMDQRIDNQNDRNAYLQGEIKQLDVRIAKIKDLDKVRAHLLARKRIIEQLQADRSQMVHLFDELVKTIPSSVRLSGLKQSGQSMSLDGVAQSNASVAEYMRNIQASPWMGRVDLRKTENSHDSSRMPYTFGLDVTLSRPKSDDVGAADDASPATAGTEAAPPTATVSAPPGTATRAINGQTAAGHPVAPAPASVAAPAKQAASKVATGGTKP